MSRLMNQSQVEAKDQTSFFFLDFLIRKGTWHIAWRMCTKHTWIFRSFRILINSIRNEYEKALKWKETMKIISYFGFCNRIVAVHMWFSAWLLSYEEFSYEINKRINYHIALMRLLLFEQHQKKKIKSITVFCVC